MWSDCVDYNRDLASDLRILVELVWRMHLNLDNDRVPETANALLANSIIARTIILFRLLTILNNLFRLQND